MPDVADQALTSESRITEITLTPGPTTRKQQRRKRPAGLFRLGDPHPQYFIPC
jgi:hypothetical protein